MQGRGAISVQASTEDTVAECVHSEVLTRAAPAVWHREALSRLCNAQHLPTVTFLGRGSRCCQAAYRWLRAQVLPSRGQCRGP